MRYRFVTHMSEEIYLTPSFRMPSRMDLLGVCMNICQQSLGFCMGHMVRWEFVIPHILSFIVIQGLGAFLAPFASTFFSGYTDRRWAFHFSISAGLCIMNIAALTYVFRLRRQEGKMKGPVKHHAFLTIPPLVYRYSAWCRPRTEYGRGLDRKWRQQV